MIHRPFVAALAVSLAVSLPLSLSAMAADNEQQQPGTRIHIEQYGLPAEFVGNPMVIEAFRSSYRKLGRLLGVATEERACE